MLRWKIALKYSFSSDFMFLRIVSSCFIANIRQQLLLLFYEGNALQACTAKWSAPLHSGLPFESLSFNSLLLVILSSLLLVIWWPMRDLATCQYLERTILSHKERTEKLCFVDIVNKFADGSNNRNKNFGIFNNPINTKISAVVHIHSHWYTPFASVQKNSWIPGFSNG